MVLGVAIVTVSAVRYVNAVKPGQYGVPKPFYFPFLPSYWYEGATCSKVQPVRFTHACTCGSGMDMHMWVRYGHVRACRSGTDMHM